MRNRGFTLIELLVALSVIGILIALLLPAVQSSRESARKLKCQSQLKQLALALHNYHDAHDVLPPGSLSVGPAFTPFSGWGWGAMLLPYVDQASLYHQIDFNTHTAEGRNQSLIGNGLAFLRCPTDPSPEKINVQDLSGASFSVAAGNYAGLEEMLDSLSHVKFRDVSDGLSNTFLLGETEYLERPDGSEATASWIGVITFRSKTIGNSRPHEGLSPNSPPNTGFFSSGHMGGTQFCMGDGQVRFINENMDREVYLALGTINGGEPIQF